MACNISTRTRYATRVATNISEGVFKLLGNLNCNRRCMSNSAPSLPISNTDTNSNTGG